ncbi:probable salivary secreted peptide [Drosophila bipectinata]|uniref:probable salivary secreted peptide n=1 Tax=Drosophila bipectinata TaxID=42026 RepID=UPI0007E83241|nr:probable salivary secreted peptide [Drosophila bipectinata]KAH8272562.1 hypothetical protein KR026_006263 [Drosophila bipectinata]KAH8331625.1 hypothetical protein KR074_008355 [Drosophila pseudoananassae]
MRAVLILSVVLAVILGGHAYSASWGKVKSGDYILSRQVEVRNPIKNNYWNLNVNYGPGFYNISAIYVYDNFKNNSGASPSLYSGGPGYRFATINLKGQVNRGINSTVEIYGR